jgi:hypothetical protein
VAGLQPAVVGMATRVGPPKGDCWGLGVHGEKS